MTSDRVTLTVTDGIADVRLNRPDKLNAMDEIQFRAVADTIARIEARRDIRCVVLSGEGRAFCVGIDLQRLSSSPALRGLVREDRLRELVRPPGSDLSPMLPMIPARPRWNWRALLPGQVRMRCAQPSGCSICPGRRATRTSCWRNRGNRSACLHRTATAKRCATVRKAGLRCIAIDGPCRVRQALMTMKPLQ